MTSLYHEPCVNCRHSALRHRQRGECPTCGCGQYETADERWYQNTQKLRAMSEWAVLVDALVARARQIPSLSGLAEAVDAKRREFR